MAAAIAAFFAQGRATEPVDSRTYYETLDLATPEEAATAFAEALASQDFLAAHLILDPVAQQSVETAQQLFDWDRLIKNDAAERLAEELPGTTHGEHFLGGWYLFDEVMRFGVRNDALLVDFSGGITLIQTKPGPTTDGPFATDVVVEVAGVLGDTVIRTTQAPSGAWRVRQVILPNGDEERVPWSVPTEPEPATVTYRVPFMVPCPSGGFEPPAPPASGPRFSANPPCASPGDVVTIRGTGLPAEVPAAVLFIPESEFNVSVPLAEPTPTSSVGTFASVLTIPDRPSDEIQFIAVVVTIATGN